MKIMSVVGARPNFMKIAPFVKAIQYHNLHEVPNGHEAIEHILVHTGQHYDDRMSSQFFSQLGISQADINLGVGSGTHAQQVGQTMIEFEKVLHQYRPNWVVVVGDVNATLACSVTAKKEQINCCHIEAGLRSGDFTMPEEINRLVTDRLSDLLLTPDSISTENLRREGVPDNRIVFVGNIMIDSLLDNIQKAKAISLENIINQNSISGQTKKDYPSENNYAIVTLHRPSNVDNRLVFESLLEFLMLEAARKLQIFWPIHPRALKKLQQFSLLNGVLFHPNITLLEPLGYLEMLRMNMSAKVVLTDSGGLQEECTVLGTPCLTLRLNTERPITLREHGGVSILVGNSIELIKQEFSIALQKQRTPVSPPLWDGKTAERCVRAIVNYRH